MPISTLTPPTDPGDLPPASLPGLTRISSSTRVGAAAANLQPQALERRTLTLLAKINEIITSVNQNGTDITTLFTQLGLITTIPSGIVYPFAGSAVPSGYLLCDGGSYSRTAYAALFAAITTTHGAVDSSHFNVPDYRGRALIGAGAGSGLTSRTLGAVLGAEVHTLTVGEIPQHYHQVSNSGESGSTGAGLAGSSRSQTSYNYTTGPVSATFNGSPASVDGAHNNMQPSAVVNFIIKT